MTTRQQRLEANRKSLNERNGVIASFTMGMLTFSGLITHSWLALTSRGRTISHSTAAVLLPMISLYGLLTAWITYIINTKVRPSSYPTETELANITPQQLNSFNQGSDSSQSWIPLFLNYATGKAWGGDKFFNEGWVRRAADDSETIERVNQRQRGQILP